MTHLAERPAALDADDRVEYRRVMTVRERVVFAVLLTVALLLTLRYAVWWYAGDRLPQNYGGTTLALVLLANVLPFAALTLLEVLRVLQMGVTWVFAPLMHRAVAKPVPTGLRVAVLTTIIPSKEPLPMLEGTLRAMLRMRHPEGFDVWVLDEEDSPEVHELCGRLGVHHFSRHGIERYNQPDGPFKARTKAGNHNAWRDQHAADYDLVAQMDPDHVPTVDFLEKTLGYFSDPDVAYVIAPQVYYRNTGSSWVARGADEQNFGFSAITQRGANRLGMPIFIGSNHVCRTAALDTVGGYSSHIVEDHITGLELLATRNPGTGRHWKGVYTDEIVSVGEGPAGWGAYLSQQLRWSYGLIDIVRHHSLRLFRRLRPTQVAGLALIQSYYISVAAILVIGMTLTTLHLLFGVDAIQVPFDEWLEIWWPQLAISIVIWYWLQRFYLRESDRGWGARAIMVGFGAMVTYTQALVLVLLRRPLRYVVTPKGEVGTREPLRLFRWHLVSLAISVAGLGWALWNGSGAPTVAFWAALNVGHMVLVTGTGAFLPRVLGRPLEWRWYHRRKARLRYAVRVATPTVLGIAGIVVAGFVPAQIAPIDLGGRGEGAPVATGPAGPGGTEVLPPVAAPYLLPGSDALAFGLFAADPVPDLPAAVRHEFVPFDADGAERMATVVTEAAAAGQVAMVSWEPRLVDDPAGSARLLDDLVAGKKDEYVAEVARALAATGQPVVLRLAPEMDLPSDRWQPWAGHDPEVFVRAWRRVHEIFQAEQATNVRFAWTPGGRFRGDAFVSDDWYPGGRYVDLVGFSAYTFWRWEERDAVRAPGHDYRMPAELIGPRYDAVLAYGKPVILPEVGVALHPSRRDEQVAWLEALVDLVDGQLEEVALVAYFQSPHGFSDVDIDWRLDARERQALADRLAEADRVATP